MNVSVNSASQKRKQEDEDETNNVNTNDNKEKENKRTTSSKYSVREGHSWWTCMMLDMPMSMTKPQRVTQNSPQN
jgi:hypothetical protein